MFLSGHIVWRASPLIHDFGFFKLTWYGLLFMSGFVIGAFILRRVFRAEQVNPDWVDRLTLYLIPATVLGARLGHCLFYDWAYFSRHPLEIFIAFPWAGLASHGATVGILLASWLFSRNYKFDYLWLLDRLAVVVAPGLAGIRLGNLLNSEIIGRETTVPWAFRFARYDQIHHLQTTIPTQLRHPTQLYEALFYLLLFGLSYGLWRQYQRQTPRGLLVGLFVTLLFSFRFLIEFLKENQVRFEDELPLNMGQLLSIPLVLAGIWILLRAGKQAGNPHGYAPRDLSWREDQQVRQGDLASSAERGNPA
ncbi:prolipoprotein diacylglyceryl transferase [uncultured Hymenobacter sp.]|uniref:prolipoprotein diacylglyceryl transferase n=1 Tax=uncultured Hymenobacter sp. TaxID=170016 RepID=UPI0035C9AE3E